MINLFLHHLNACKVKLRLHLRGTKEKSFKINKAEPPDNWNFILLFGTAYRCKKYRICQKKSENFSILQQEIGNTDICHERDFSTSTSLFFSHER